MGDHPVADLVRAIGSALGKPVNIEFMDMPEPVRANYQYFTQAQMGKLKRAGYAENFLGLEEGVADYVGRYLAQPDIYRLSALRLSFPS